jgi:nicotinamide-nucleotide amidase
VTSEAEGVSLASGRPKASIVVTGSELVRGERTDRNGPFYARQALALGLQPSRIAIVGDDPAELERALQEASDTDICLVSGGLGPTHDDRTIELVARVAGVPLELDVELEARIEAISRGYAERLGRPYADFASGVTKQATLPRGSVYVGPSGTAPGVVLDTGTCVFVVLPGPPPELQALWPLSLATPAFQRVLSRAVRPSRRVLRLFGISESAVAKAFHEAGGDGDGVEVTICAREFEIHVDLVVEPGAEDKAEALSAALRAEVGEHVFADDERTVQEIVLDLCRERRWTLGTAESCTGGLVAGRLTDVPGASDVFLGSVVAYANSVKERELGVPAATLAEHGAVSAETAAALAHGLRDRLGVDCAVSVTGVAGPGGGTKAKPVGLVHLHAVTPAGEASRRLDIPGDRETIRQRSAVVALHLLRTVLEQSRDETA